MPSRRFRGILGVVPDELLSVLMRFHREVVIADIQRIVGSAVAPIDSRLSALESNVVALRNDMLSHFDGTYKRFDRLESEYQAFSVAVKRLEDRRGPTPPATPA